MREVLIARTKAGLKAKLIIQIYDDLRFECPLEEVQDLIGLVVPIMQQPFNIYGVERSFKTDVEIGHSWGDLQTVEDEDYATFIQEWEEN